MLLFNQNARIINHQYLWKEGISALDFCYIKIVTKERSPVKLLLLVGCGQVCLENESHIHFKNYQKSFFTVFKSIMMKWLYWLPQSYFLLAYNVQRVIAEVVYQRIWGSSNSVSCSAKHVKKYFNWF